MWSPALRAADVDAERSVILDEILMHADEPSDLAAEEWQAALFAEHPLGRDTLGTAETVEGLTDVDIRGFFEHHTGRPTWSSRPPATFPRAGGRRPRAPLRRR